MASQIDSQRPTLPVLEATPVAARHIVRADPHSDGAVEVLPGAWWAPADGDGLPGENGWVSASVERRTRDASQLQGLVLPNATGDDGILHRDRFTLRDDPNYRLGDEWIELTDQTTGEALAITTPETGRVDRTTVNVGGPDAAALLMAFREGKVATWTPHAAQDVIDWYSRAPRALLVHRFAPEGTNGWVVTGTGGEVVRQTVRGVETTVADNPQSQVTVRRFLHPPLVNGLIPFAPFTATVRGEIGAALPNAKITMMLLDYDVQPIGFTYEFGGSSAGARVTCGAPKGYTETNVTIPGNAEVLQPGDAVEASIVCVEGWYVFLVNGVTVGQLRRSKEQMVEEVVVTVQAANLTLTDVDYFENLPFLRRGAPTPDYQVAGAPTPGGLRGDYYLTYDQWIRSGGDYARYGAQIPAPLDTPYAQRLDAKISFDGAPPTWQPPGPPNGEGFAVRWSGAILAELAENPYLRLRLAGTDDMAQVWVGDTMNGTQYLYQWGMGAAGTMAGVYLRDHLDSTTTGWYPIVIEYAQGANIAAAIHLQSTTDGVTWTDVPPEKLSPYGCFEGDLGGESYRAALDSVTTSSGLNWRLQPRTLESGEFPGRLEVATALGRSTDYILSEDEATEYASEVRAADVVDQVTADAQGLGDNLGREGLTASIIAPDAVSRPWLLTRAETLSDITERTLLQQRLSTILALYGSPAEEIAARPRGARTLTDSFPTTGAARAFLWEPDDRIRVQLPTIGVNDRTPRAITSITWPLAPAGRGAPQVGFRQRPRHLRDTLRRLQHGVAVQRRRYQGQLAQVSGSLGGYAGADEYSRISLVPGTVAQLKLRVMEITGTGTIRATGVDTGLTVTRPGEYDVTAWCPPGPYAYAQIIGAASINFQLVATVRI